MNDKLKSAESAINFIQKEHERVLHGLHMEIERLQQKCSGKSKEVHSTLFSKENVRIFDLFAALTKRSRFNIMKCVVQGTRQKS